LWSRHTPMITASRRFMGFGKGASHHNGVGPAGERLANIPAFAHPAVGDDRDKAGSFFEIGVARGRAIDGGRNLRHAKAEDPARSASCSRPDSHQNRGRSTAHALERHIVADGVANDHGTPNFPTESSEIE